MAHPRVKEKSAKMQNKKRYLCNHQFLKICLVNAENIKNTIS